MMEKTSLFEFSSIDELEKQIFDKYNSDKEFKKEREKVYYKAFRISDIIERSGDHIIKETIKNLDSTKEKDNIHTIANVAASSLNNGISCWLEDTGEVSTRKKKGYLTIATNCYVGCCFYQDDEFVSTGDNNYIIIKDNIFKEALDKNIKGYKLLAKYLTLIYHNKFHDWGRKLGSGNDFNREIILLPVYKDSGNQEVISVKTLSYLYDRIKFNEYKQKIEELERERYSIKEALKCYNSLSKEVQNIKYVLDNGKNIRFLSDEIIPQCGVLLYTLLKSIKDNTYILGESPDIQVKTTDGNYLLFEEFEINDEKVTKKDGSLKIKRESEIEREMLQENTGISIAIGCLHECSEKYLLANFIEAYTKHAKKIPTYRKNAKSKKSELYFYIRARCDNPALDLSDENPNDFKKISLFLFKEVYNCIMENENKPDGIFIVYNDAIDYISTEQYSKPAKSIYEYHFPMIHNESCATSIKHKKKLVYKAFRVGDLFERDSSTALKESIKELDSYDFQNSNFSIPCISSSAENNGICKYLKEDEFCIPEKDALTIAGPGSGSGTVFFQNGKFYYTYNVRVLRLKGLLKRAKLNIDSYKYLAKLLTKVFVNRFHGFTRNISAGNDFNREIILLPCYETELNENIKITEFQENLIRKNKNNKILKKEKEKDISIPSPIKNSIEIATDRMGYLYTLIRVNQFNKKAKQLQDEIISL